MRARAILIYNLLCADGQIAEPSGHRIFLTLIRYYLLGLLLLYCASAMKLKSGNSFILCRRAISPVHARLAQRVYALEHPRKLHMPDPESP